MTITRKQVPNNKRIQHTADLFGLNFPLHLEPFVYAITGSIADDYDGGYWEFYELSNGGFYMAPHSDSRSRSAVKMATRASCQAMPWGLPLAFMPIAICRSVARAGSTKLVPGSITG